MALPIIRLIEKRDNPNIALVIRQVLEDLGVPKVGTAYADSALDCMFETYQNPRTAYFVVEKNRVLLGGAGIAPLENYKGNICELQKMYFIPEARGLGIGKQLMEFCIAKAREFKFDQIYLETMEYMVPAQKLYRKSGFDYIEGPIGNTGHFSCPVQMLKDL
ncbi:GNAT family N-acetyltransferase [Aequorivita sp. H23M31]|uniref:GNAT family N-acetyltransferase n=1 Tax=Aequorivita ciconiae TaxID=2494375 RepID=A0A410G077_9FLAO|nr:GNAT family N-acetyltransferase [Aequorivita sp. H23M31]QAA80676.1 GNAT family N-acetyltransferase [Aequorivita sp. H23M31]